MGPGQGDHAVVGMEKLRCFTGSEVHRGRSRKQEVDAENCFDDLKHRLVENQFRGNAVRAGSG